MKMNENDENAAQEFETRFFHFLKGWILETRKYQILAR